MLRLKTLLQYNIIYIVLLFFVLVYAFLYSNHGDNSFSFSESFTGILIDRKIDGNKISMTLKNDVKVNATYYASDKETLEYFDNLPLGIKMKIHGEEKEVLNNTIPNTFNYKNYLKHKNIKALIDVDKYKVINNKTNLFYDIKNTLRDYIKTFQSKDYLETFIIGKKEFLDSDTYSDYQKLGVSHIFAISGMHISLLTAIVLKLLSKFKDNKRYVIVIVFLLIYLFITNYTASVSRSIILFIILYLNKMIDLNISNINCYLISIAILLFIFPNFIYDIGFIYSSVISFALIRYSCILKGNYFVSLLKVSILAFLFSLPITIMNNYEINILSIINNLFFVPVISFVIYPLSLLTLVIKPLDIILVHITDLIEFISKYLFIYNIIIPKMHAILIVLYYVILIVFMKTYNKSYLLFLILLILLPKYSYLIDDNYYVYFFDVNQGDSALIRYKDKSILIDTGGKVKYTKEEWMQGKMSYVSDNVIKFMKSIGINKLDYLIISHGDYDHMGDATHLIDNFKIDKVILNCGTYNNLEDDLIKKLDNNKIIHYSCINELNIKDNKLYFLNTKEYNNENDDSNVIYVKLNNYKFLFMGDAGVEKENDILNKYDLGNIDFLKVGHHGSNTSSSKLFIDSIIPKYSLISVGRNNRYHHPKNEVLDTLSSSKVYRTDLDGSIEIRINKRGCKVATYAP